MHFSLQNHKDAESVNVNFKIPIGNIEYLMIEITQQLPLKFKVKLEWILTTHPKTLECPQVNLGLESSPSLHDLHIAVVTISAIEDPLRNQFHLLAFP